MKKFISVAFIFIVVVFVVLYLVSSRKQSPGTQTHNTTPTPTLMPSIYRDINIETAPASSVISSLGAPIRTNSYKGATTYIYSSSNPDLNLSVEVNSNNSIKKIMEPTLPSFTYATMISLFGAPELALYGTLENLGFRLFVYPSKGTAILANSETGEAKMRWYFSRMTPQAFLQTLGEGYSTEYDPKKQ